MPATVLLAALNHLLAAEEWAPRHLAAFRGQIVRIKVPPVALCLEITPEGLFVRAPQDGKATVTLTLPADFLFRVLSGTSARASLFSSAQITGSADLAECLGFVFRNLTWDAEGDLAPFIGDIAAHRLVRGMRAFLGVPPRLVSSLARNAADYLADERQLLVRQRDGTIFCREVDALVARLSALERRVSSLTSRSRLAP